MLLARIGDGHADGEHGEHGREDGPRLPAHVGHAPEHEDLRRRDQQDGEHLEEVRDAVRVLERDGRVRVEVATSVRAELLDGDLRGDGAARDRLLSALERRHGLVAGERLRDALGDEDDREDDGERQEDVGERAIEVDPEVPELPRRAAGEPAHEGREHRHPDRGRDEVLHGQARHLAEVGHRALARVVLPVRVRDEARRRVHGDVREHAREVGRVEGQQSLEAEDEVEEDRERAHEDERRLRVALPVLPAVGPRADEPVEAPLGEAEPAGEAEAVRVDPGHVAAEGIREEDEDDRVEDDLPDPGAAHLEGFSARGRGRRRGTRRCRSRSGAGPGSPPPSDPVEHVDEQEGEGEAGDADRDAEEVDHVSPRSPDRGGPGPTRQRARGRARAAVPRRGGSAPARDRVARSGCRQRPGGARSTRRAPRGVRSHGSRRRLPA